MAKREDRQNRSWHHRPQCAAMGRCFSVGPLSAPRRTLETGTTLTNAIAFDAGNRSYMLYMSNDYGRAGIALATLETQK